MQKRTYLTIMPDNKKDALRAAGRLPDGGYPLEYDRSQKLWFAKPEADLEKVKAWLPENTATGKTHTVAENLTPVEEFSQVLSEAGFVLPDNGLPEMDGKRHRVATEGDKAGSKSGVYQGFMDGRPAGWYQNHRASEGKVNWSSTGAYQYDPVEAIRQRALAAQKRWDREMKSRADYTRIAKTLTRQWSKMPAAPDTHPYLSRKGVPAAQGIRLDIYDNLVIPLRNTTGELRTLQYIKPDGTKNLKKDAEKTGNFFVVGGELSLQLPVLYAEGYATAASLHQATGLPVVMTVDAGNMVTVSQKLKALYPDTAHIILGEDDFTKTDNKGLNKAREAAAAIDGTYIIPQFTESERTQAFAGTASFSDFNDIHSSRGLDAVRDQLAPVLDPLLPDWRSTIQTVPSTTQPLYTADNSPDVSPQLAPTGQQANKVKNMPDDNQQGKVDNANSENVRALGEAIYSRAMSLARESHYVTPESFSRDIKRFEKEFKQYQRSGDVSQQDIDFTAAVFAVIRGGRDADTLQYDWQGRLDAPTLVRLVTADNALRQQSAQAEVAAKERLATAQSPATSHSAPPAPQTAASLTPAAPVSGPPASEQTIEETTQRPATAGTSPTETLSEPEPTPPQPANTELPTVDTDPKLVETGNGPDIPESQPAEAQSEPDPTLQQSADTVPPEVDAAPQQSETENSPETTLSQRAETETAPPTATELPSDAVIPVAGVASPEPEVPPVVGETQTTGNTPEAEPAEENGFTFTFGRHAGDVSPQEAAVPRINLDELLQGLSSRQEDRTWIYALDGQDAFRDYGDRIVMASPEASENDRMILAALLSAKANQRGAVEITGSEAFILRTMTLIADHNIEVHLKNPHQREQFEALLKARAENTVPQNGLDIGPAGPSVEPTSAAAATDTQGVTPVAPVASEVPSTASTQPAAPELTMVEKETLRTGLTGKLLDAGKAPYQFDKSKTDSFYVQMRTKDGNKTFWGVELEQALKDSGKQPGDMVKLQFLGKKQVTVNVPVKGADGKVTGLSLY